MHHAAPERGPLSILIVCSLSQLRISCRNYCYSDVHIYNVIEFSFAKYLLTIFMCCKVVAKGPASDETVAMCLGQSVCDNLMMMIIITRICLHYFEVIVSVHNTTAV